MRVLVVTTWYPRRDAPGRAVFCRRHAEALALHHDVRVLSLDAPGAEMLTDAESAVPVELVPFDRARPATLAGALRAVRARVRAQRPDVVVTMGFSSLVPGAALRGLGVPWVHVEHWTGVTVPSSSSALWARLAPVGLRLFRLPDVVVGVTQYLCDVVRPYARATAVVPNVVDTPASVPERPTALRVASVGSLTPIKQPELVARAAAIVRESVPDAEFRWAGDGPLRAQTEQAIADLGLEGTMTLLGQVPHEELDALYGWCSHVVLPSTVETFSVVAAEALVHGRPVVMGPEGGHRSFVTDEVGTCAEDLTPEGLAATILAEHRRFAGVPAQHFRDAIGARFSAEAVADAFDAAIAVARRGR